MSTVPVRLLTEDEYLLRERGALVVEEFEEPRITEERYHLAGSERRLRNSRSRPYSVAFRLRTV